MQLKERKEKKKYPKPFMEQNTYIIFKSMRHFIRQTHTHTNRNIHQTDPKEERGKQMKCSILMAQ